jgi:hypothetical protein
LELRLLPLLKPFYINHFTTLLVPFGRYCGGEMETNGEAKVRLGEYGGIKIVSAVGFLQRGTEP